MWQVVWSKDGLTVFTNPEQISERGTHKTIKTLLISEKYHYEIYYLARFIYL